VLTFLPVSANASPLNRAWHAIEPDVVRIATAFASETGVEELRGKIIGKLAFDSAEKQWLVGIQDGITQPKALERLRSRENSEVRVPFGSAAMADANLKAPDFFHPKLYYFENSSAKEVAIVSTSANLTLSGLRTNVEQALVWCGARGDGAAEEMNGWWNELWGNADPATSSFITGYEAKRPRLPARKKPSSQEPADSVLREASSFWIELARKPEGGSYNQIELLYNGHFFFYPDAKEPSKAAGRPLTFEDDRSKIYDDVGRQVTFNGPPRMPTGNSMWRVYMPTLAMGFRGYQDGDVLVRFKRTSQPDHYLVEVAAARSPLALAWIDGSSFVEHPGPPPHRMGWS
jgi:HKD family nuclease